MNYFSKQVFSLVYAKYLVLVIKVARHIFLIQAF